MVNVTVPVGVGPLPVTDALSWMVVPWTTDVLVMFAWLALCTCVVTLDGIFETVKHSFEPAVCPYSVNFVAGEVGL
jgi:hypothetical protein